MIISERIFVMIKERGMSQKEFSLRTGISQSTISDWKRKKTNPASDKIMIICDVLEVTPYELLSGAQEKGKYRQVDYVMVDKKSEEFKVLNAYRELSPRKKSRLLGYAEALAEK